MRKLYQLVSLPVLIFGIVQMTCTLAMAGKFQYASTFSIYQVYDDNIFYGEHQREGDFITIVSPNSVLSYESPKARISASYMSGLEFFYANPDENTTQNQNASIRLKLQPTERITLEASDRMRFYAVEHNRGLLSGGGGLGYVGYYGQFRREEALEVTPKERAGDYADILAWPTDYWSNSIDTNVSYQISKSITTGVGYNNRFVNYNEVEGYGGLEDTREYGYRGELKYQHSIRNTFDLEYEYRSLSYTREMDTDVHFITTGWLHQFSPTISLEWSGGPALISFVDGGENEVDWQMTARITKSYRHASIGLGYTRDVDFFRGLGGSSISQVWSLDINGRPTRQLDVSLTGSYSIFQPIVREEERVSSYYQDLDTYTGGLTLGYDFTRRLRGTSSYFYTHQNIETIGVSHYHQAMGGLEYMLTSWLTMNILYTYSSFGFPFLLAAEETADVNIYDNRIMLGFSFTWARPM